MKEPEIKKAIVRVQYTVGNVYLRESILAEEVEILLRKPLNGEDFRRELTGARDAGLVVKDLDSFGEPIYSLTPVGAHAARSLT